MKSSKKRISSVFAILVMAIVLSCIFAACDKVGEKQVPVYKGMTISRSFATSSAATAAEDNGNHYGHFKGDHNNRNDEVDQNKPFEDPNAPSIENKANSTLDVVGSAESIYYADKNQNVFITIKLSNPDSYEILSFTLNGKKYSNYMFENGSDMENLVLKVNVGDVGGIVEYTIDAIKYVDGTEIKDVRMDGNRTVKAGVRASDQTYVNVTNEKKTMTSISFDAQVVDLYSLIEKSGGYAKAVLYDGVNMLTKDIKVGEKTNVVFDNLTPNTVYQYGVVALYDNLSGNGAKLNTLYKKAVYTDTIVLFNDVQVGKESIEWGFLWNESFASKQMSAISLWQNGAKVQDVDTTATRLDGLKSNNKYTLKATYKNLQNQDETIEITFVTYAKAVPTVEIANVQSTQTKVSFELNVTDTDNVGAISKIELLHGDDEPIVASDLTARTFENLLSNNDYTVKVTYTYDLNDGVGERQIVKTTSITTKAKAVPTVEIANAQSTQTQVSFELNVTDTDNVGAISKIELLHGEDAPIVAETSDISAFDHLLSNNDYTIQVTYTYNLNDGVGEQQIVKTTSITTKTKAVPTIEIANVQSTQTQVSFELNITDTDNVGAITKIELLHGEDVPIVAETSDIRAFENLLSNNDYTVKVTYNYDLNDGVGERQIVQTTSITTKAKAVPTVEITNAQSTQTQVSFELNVTDTDNVGAISKIELLHGEDAPIVAETSDIRAFENLFSNNDYTVKVTYNYDLNDGVGERQIVKTASIKTKAKAMPSATISNLSSTQSTIECDVAYTDIDSVGSVVEIALYRLENKIKSVPFATHVSFDGLESGKEYKVVVTYKYDLNDGKSEQTATANAKYSTLIDSIVVDSLILLNNNVVKLGEELNLRVYFTNSSEIELTGIYVNGQKTTVVGGDRIESAIVKFVPTTSGLCKFAIDRVDYVINGIEVNQAIDSNVDVEYPIYRDIDITYTPITISKYENTGDGVYISFDNEDGYTVFKVNESDDFVTVDSGRIFTKDISITSIEYGYADYGHTTQSCDFKNDYWSAGIHNVTALKRIYTVEDFFAMTDGYYLLMNDLDLRSVQTKAQIKLTGIFDANGHTIRGLSNVVDTSKYEYFDLFQGGSIYDATFKELYVSVNHTSNGNSLYVRPLGNATLYNCTVKGDVMLSDSVNYGDLNIADDSTTYSLNVTIGTMMSTQKHTAATPIAKDTHIVERDDVFYFDCEVGKAFLSYANRNTADYTVEDGTFFVRSYAFAGSETLKNIVMPESVKRVGDYSVFANCIIENAVIPIRLLEQLNYEQRKQLVTLSLFGDGVTEIGDSAFSGCNKLTSVVIPDSVTSIGDDAFCDCCSLTSVTIGNGVTSIGNYAFYNCSGLISITIPDSVTSIGINAFCNCSGLTDITIGDGVMSIEIATFSGCSNLTSITIGNSVTSIGESAFLDCSSLTSVIIPDSVMSMGSSAFSGCSNLTSVIIGNSVPSIGDSVFYNCNRLTSVTIPNSVMSIGNSAFYNCSGLMSIEIPDSVAEIGDWAFHNCSSLMSVHILNIAKWCAISFGSYSSNPLEYAHNLYVNGVLVKDLIIPDSVTSIGESAFYGCSGLTSITIPDSVTSIGDSAFSRCDGLTRVTISKNTTSIGEGAFGSCGNLQYVLYDDTAIRWGQINIKSNNDCLMSAKKLYNHDGKTRTYTFVTNSTQENFSMSGLYLDELPVVEKEGYDFCGWYDNQQFDGARITTPYYDDKNTVLYAKWEIIHYTIKYDFGDAMSVSKAQNNPLNPLSYTILDEIEFAKPQRKGYTFVSWDKNILKGTTGEIVVTAQWVVDEYSIEYVLNGWTNSERNKTTYTIEYGNIILYDAIHDGSLFCGWYLDEACKDFVETISADELKNYTVYTNPTNFATAGLSIQNDTITGYNGTEKEVSIPSYYKGKPVLKIGKDAFNSNANIRKVVIPDSITVIGDSAFYRSGLTSLDIPDSVTSIGGSAFQGCTGLTSVTIPNSVASIGNYAFSSCNNLQDIYLTDIAAWCNISGLGNLMEYGSSDKKLYLNNALVTSVTIPDGVTTIPDSAFSGCSGLTSVTIPNSVTSIGEYAFSRCNKLQDIYITDIVAWCNISGLNYLMSYGSSNKKLYINNELVTSITIPDGVTEIPSYAFSGCKGLTSVTILNSVTSVGDYAFSGCEGLTSVTIPDSVTSIGNEAFRGCSELTKITGPSSIVSSVAKQCGSNSFKVIITSGTSIGDSAFSGCTGLTSVTIPNSVTSVGSSAFSGCSRLTSITIPNSVTSIGSSAFSGCTGLTSVTISDSVTSIGESAFSGCSSLESITIPFVGAKAGVTSSDTYQYPFGYIFGTSSYIGGVATNQYYYGSSTSSTTDTTYYIPSSLKSVTVTGGNILHGAFYNCTGLTSVTIGNSVTSIGEWAFSGCSGLTSITIPDSVTSIGDRAFESTELTSIIVVEGNSKYHSAGNCLIETATKTLILGCKTSVIPADGSVTSIGFEAFRGCIGLTSITIPDSVTSIGVAAFYYCSDLTSVTIGSGVTSIGDMAFSYCSGLTSVTIPDSVTSIGYQAFYDCTGLTSITFNGTIAQWNAIAKGKDWNMDVPSTCQIVCIDGIISVGNVE